MSLNPNSSETSFVSKPFANFSQKINAFNCCPTPKSISIPVEPTFKPIFGGFNKNINVGMVRPM